MKTLAQAVLIALALGGCTVTVGSRQQDGAPINVGTRDEQEAVVAAAHVAAGLLDAGQFEQLWEGSCPLLKDRTPRVVFIAGLKAMRGPLGAATRRKVSGFNFSKVLDGVQGEFGVIGVEADFEHGSAVQEKYVFQRVDGTWRLAGYWVTKQFSLGARGPRDMPGRVAG